MKRLLGFALCAILMLAMSVALAEAKGSRGSKALVRAYSDGQGNRVVLLQGKGSGHKGDWGWLHIKGKHIDGVWYDGGRITTFPQALGTTTDGQVQDLIGDALRVAPRTDHGRRLFLYRPSRSTYQVLVVVGSDGTIITSYPQR